MATRCNALALLCVWALLRWAMSGPSSVTLGMGLLHRLAADVAGTNVPAPAAPVRPLSAAPAP